jgi:hypothetical protein
MFTAIAVNLLLIPPASPSVAGRVAIIYKRSRVGGKLPC